MVASNSESNELSVGFHSSKAATAQILNDIETDRFQTIHHVSVLFVYRADTFESFLGQPDHLRQLVHLLHLWLRFSFIFIPIGHFRPGISWRRISHCWDLR